MTIDSASFGTFIDRALFAPRVGYYASGRVQIGDGGDFETFPTALSPLFGRLVAERALALWRGCGAPRRFEVLEIGAGDGQLPLDTICHVLVMGARKREWARFGRALRYVICERSPSLVTRQQERLRGLPSAQLPHWTDVNLLRPNRVRRARARFGMVVANEVLDCLPHERIVVSRSGRVRATMVSVDARRGPRPALVDLARVPGLDEFLRRFRPEIFARRRRPELTYFACAALIPFLQNLAYLYARSELWLIDYGGVGRFHLRAPERQKLWVGKPHAGAPPPPRRVYRTAGREDITFLVDFDVVRRAAHHAGLAVVRMGPQAILAQRAGVMLRRSLADEIVRHRMARWAIGLFDPTTSPRRRVAVGFGSGRTTVAADVKRSLAQFSGRLKTPFRAVVLQRRGNRGRGPGRERSRRRL